MVFSLRPSIEDRGAEITVHPPSLGPEITVHSHRSYVAFQICCVCGWTFKSRVSCVDDANIDWWKHLGFHSGLTTRTGKPVSHLAPHGPQNKVEASIR